MSFNRVEVTPEIPGPNAPEATPTGKPSAKEAQQTPPPEVSNDRPEWLPEKFKSAEDLAKAYSELEKKQGKPEEKPTETPKKEPEEGEPKPETKPEDKPQETPKADAQFQEFFQEFEEKGEISEQSYEKLSKMGFSRDVVDAYKHGVTSKRAAAENSVFEAVGGKENWPAVSEWATKNLSAPDVEAVNKILAGGDPAQMKLTMAGLYSQFQESQGRPAKLIRGSASGSAVQPFRSSAEVRAAMNDPRYRQGDPAYHAEVKQRLAASEL